MPRRGGAAISAPSRRDRRPRSTSDRSSISNASDRRRRPTMATARQRKASRENLKKARRVWQRMSPSQRARSQPRRDRAKPGSTGRGAFFHIEVRPKREFDTFRTQDVGRSGGIERVAGKRGSGSWDTQKWLIAKQHAHMTRGGRLVADSAEARKVLDAL